MKKMSKRNLWLAAIILSYLYMLISKKMINTYKENEILVLNYSASMICDFALLGMFIIRQAKMKKRFQIFKNSFQSFKDAYSKKSAFEKNLKNDEKVEKFGKAIRTTRRNECISAKKGRRNGKADQKNVSQIVMPNGERTFNKGPFFHST